MALSCYATSALLVVVVLLGQVAQLLLDTQPAMAVVVGCQRLSDNHCLMVGGLLLQVQLPQFEQRRIIHQAWRKASRWPLDDRGTWRLQDKVNRQVVSEDRAGGQNGSLPNPWQHTV
jgi:hypothetical protein